MKNIGFIGLGNMGSYMALNLIKSGYEIFGFDTNKNAYDFFKDNKLNKCKSINEITEACKIIFTMLPDGKIVKKVWEECLKNMSANSIVIDCSTIDVETSILLHKKSKEKWIKSLDAPVSGGTIGAKDGTLTFMVGGENDTFKEIKPYFKIMGKNYIYCGSGGDGQGNKLCNNLLLAITMTGLGEVIHLAKELNLNLENLFNVMSTSTSSCWALNSYCPIKNVGPNSPADNDFKPGFSSSLMLKDLTLALEACKKIKYNPELGEKVLKKYFDFVKAGKGNLDFSSIVNEVHK